MVWYPRLPFLRNQKAKNKWIRGLVEGNSNSEIAVKCAVSRSTIVRWNKKYNIPSFKERSGYKINDYLHCIEQLNLRQDYCIHGKKWAYDLNSSLEPMDVVMNNNPNLYWFRCEINKEHIWKETPDGSGIQVPENFLELLARGDFEEWIIKNTKVPGHRFPEIRWWSLERSHNRDREVLECPYCLGLKPFDGEEYILISNIHRSVWKIRDLDSIDGNYFIPPKANTSVSKLELSWLKGISEERGIRIAYQWRGADGYCSETNTIFEFHGDIWHGNPDKFSPRDFPCFRRPFASAKLLHLETLNREKTFKMLGFNLETIWESDYLKTQKD